MKRLSKKQIGRAACTILQQLALTTPLNVVYSWGITNKVATQIEITVDGMEKNVAALMMDVNGFNYQGRLYVTNNRVKQTFGLYSEQNGMLHEEKKSIAYKDLGQALIDLSFGNPSTRSHSISSSEKYIHLGFVQPRHPIWHSSPFLKCAVPGIP